MNKRKNRPAGRLLALLLVAVLTALLFSACGETSVTTSRSLSTPEAQASAAATTASATAPAATTGAATTEAASNTGAGSGSFASETQAAEKVAQSSTTQAAQPAATPNPTTPAQTQSSDLVESNSVVEVVKKASPAVVTVYNKSKYRRGALPAAPRVTPTPAPNNDSAGNGFVVQGIGSGVIISSDGYIVTNEHVVDGQDDLAVALNDGKTTVPAKLIGADKLGDLAVLKIDVPVPAFVKWADQVQVGETVVAIGAALGNFRNSVSKGVVSGLNRTLPGDSGSNVYLQTDTAINHGNSGGPLLNLRGEIVGINTAVLRTTGPGTIQRGTADVAEGLGFAIPGQLAKILSEQLISKGKVVRPYFGISYQMITPAEAGTQTVRGQTVPVAEGAWISRSSSSQPGIVRGGPAEKAGLQENDVITAIDGVALNDANPLGTTILKYRPGDTVKLTVKRGDRQIELTLTLGERPNDL